MGITEQQQGSSLRRHAAVLERDGSILGADSQQQRAFSVVLQTVNEEGSSECLTKVGRSVEEFEITTDIVFADSSTIRWPEIAREHDLTIVELGEPDYEQDVRRYQQRLIYSDSRNLKTIGCRVGINHRRPSQGRGLTRWVYMYRMPVYVFFSSGAWWLLETVISTMERRDVLKRIGGIGAAGIIGAAGLGAMTGGAAASANTDYGDVTITSDDGTVEYVAIHGESTIEWDGFENEATAFDIDIDARVVDVTEWVDLHEEENIGLDSDWGNNESLSGPGTSGSIETSIGLDSENNVDTGTDWHVVGDDPDEYTLPNNSIDPAELEVDSDGGSSTFTVQIRTTYTWYADGSKEFEKEFRSPVEVEVTNEEKSASGSSSNTGARGA